LKENNNKSSDQFIMDWGDEEDKKDKNPSRKSDAEKKPEFEIEWQ
jgi:hypothetical protein